MSFVAEHNFSIKKWIFGQLSKSPLSIAVGLSVSILAPAAFWKASHLKSSAIFSKLLSNRGSIAANCDESVFEAREELS